MKGRPAAGTAAAALALSLALLLVPPAAAAPSGWGSAVALESNAAGSALSPAVAFDAAGNGFAVWYQSDGARSSIWASVYAPATGWGAPALLETDDAGDAVLPQVAASASGDAFAVWRQSDADRANIWAARYAAGAGWQNATLLEADDRGWAQAPRVAADAAGNAVAVWSQGDGNYSSIFAARYAGGVGWEAPALLEGADGDAQDPAVALDASGAGTAVWSQFDGTRNNVWAARLAPGAGWGTPVLLERSDTGWALAPKVAAGSTGDALAVWQQSDGVRTNVWGARYQAGLGWGAPELVERSDSGDALRAEVAVDGAGNGVAVWHQFAGARFGVFGNRYVGGAGWGSPAALDGGAGGDAVLPDVAVDPSGNAVAAWYQYDGTRNNVWAARFVPGAGWGAPSLLESSDAGNAADPAVAVDAGGNATAVWHAWDGARFQAWSNRFAVPTAPSAPTGLSATALDGRVDLSWQPPAEDGGANLTGYNVYRGPAADSLTLLAFVAGTLNYSDGSASNGARYFYAVTALNGFREGARSAPFEAAPVGAPSAPRAVTVEGGDGRATVAWLEPATDGGLAVQGYRVYRSAAGGPASLAGSPNSSASFNDTGLDNGVAYTYTVSAVNVAGEGPESAGVMATPIGPPPPPRGLAATQGPGRASITWQAPISSGGSPITGYSLYRAAPGSNLTLLVALGDLLLFDDLGLRNGVTYTYLVRAVNEFGVGRGSEVFLVTPLGPPAAPAIEDISVVAGAVGLRWSAPSDTGGSPITGYVVYRRSASGNATRLVDLGLTLEYTDGGLAFDQGYYYQVSAVNALGEGPRSAVAGATLGARPDTTKPTVAITSPAPGAGPAAGAVRFAGTASDDVALLKVEVSTDGVSWTAVAAVPRATLPGVDWTAELTLAEGARTLFVRATDASGNDATASVSVAVGPAAAPPPSAGADVSSGSAGLIGLAVAGAGGAAGAWALLVLGRRRRQGAAGGPDLVEPQAAVPAPRRPPRAPVAVQANTAPPHAAGAEGQPRRTYLVEDLFLLYHDGRVIFSRGGLGAGAVEDPDSVGVMLVAVQDFIRDSFKKGEAVDRMSYGDNAILLRKGEHIILGVTVFGETDAAFVDLLQEMVGKVEGTYAGIIEEWDGNKTRFKKVEDLLAPLFKPTSDLTRADVLLATNQPVVDMISGVEFFQGYVRLKIAVVNNTPSVITGVTVDLDLNKEVLRLQRIEPAGYRFEGTKASVGVLHTGEKVTLAYYFDPQMCMVSVIDGTCRYKDHEGGIHTVSMKSRKAEVVCPLFFTREQANTAVLRRLVESDLKQFDVKAFTIGAKAEEGALHDLFEEMKALMLAHDVQLVRTFESHEPYRGEAWFYGKTQKGFQTVMRCALDGEARRAEYYVAAASMRAVTGLLAELAHQFDQAARDRFASLKVEGLFDEELKRTYADPVRVGKLIEGVAPS
jgi:hypothetical protein